ncbi:Transcription factor GT-2 [Handroanthus impetiginosus]|uniref:Transcription factor GT-2 n=1 Tax=Handroanthus impetiginosus TaxID=429701 RepID=A0A2G9IA14_9LAMI|nr:Transcription factor GT-2 [Handroanthus impetiginosus]
MFDSDQLQYQFIASRTSSSLPIIPLSFPLSGNPLFDPYSSSSSSSLHTQIIHNTTKNNIDDENKVENPINSTSFALQTERSMDPWSNDEVLALLKLRSTMEIWFPDFTWEHISRKLGELGYKKSAEQCKEKFEEESRSFNTVSSNKNNIFSELDELYPAEKTTQHMEKVYKNHVEENPSPKSDEEVIKKPLKSSKKRKRSSSSSSSKDTKLEKFKGFCEAFVKKMMAQQEEMHNKMIEDILKRDEAKIARDEAWKNQEKDRIKKEIEVRASEQENAAKRQGKIIEFLKKFTCEKDQILAKNVIASNSYTSVCNNRTSSTDVITAH